MTGISADSHRSYRKFKPRQFTGRVLLYIAVALVLGATLFPVYWMMICTFQPNIYTLHYPPPLIPKAITLDQFVPLFQNHPMAVWLKNSLYLSVVTMVICTVLTVLGAYAFSCMRWKGRNAFGLALLITQMLPEILTLIPIFVILRRLSLLDTVPAVSAIDAAYALPICIWILKAVFDTVPSEVLDAAEVDGCTRMGVLWKIVLPLSAPGLVAVAVVAFFAAWNEYLFASILLGSQANTPATVGIPSMKMFGFTPVEQYMAAGLIFSILPVVFYLTMQKYIISGLTAGAVKG